MNSRKIAATYTALPEGLVRNCIVEVDGEGKIVSIERDVKDLDSRSGVEYFGGLLIAGMINCHCHLEYSYVKGMIPRGGGLPAFISNIIDIKYNRPIDESVKREMAAKWDAVMFKNGITAVGDHNNNDYVTDIKVASRIYYHTFIELYDADNEDAVSTFAAGVKRSEQQRERGLTTSVVPHATYTISDALLELICDEKNEGVLSTHFKESVVLGGETETERMITALAANRPSTLLVHSVYATKEDIERAKGKFGDRFTVSPCPVSNIYVENRLPDYDMLMASGVRIAMGTDGLSSNDKLSIVEEMKCIGKHYPHIELTTLIDWATRNGAEALCIDSWAGTIEINKKPGLVLIDNVDFQNMKLTDESTAIRIV